jgi:5-methylcytosine-specific restriction endonuclease McrA
MAKQKIPTAFRREVTSRAGGYCEYCLANSLYADSPFDIDHVFAESEGGKTEPANLALACHGCNLSKSNRSRIFDPLTEQFVELFDPRRDRWSDHFAWTSNFSEIVGVTLTGRVTVEALRLNRAGLVNQRIVLAKLGLHPRG